MAGRGPSRGWSTNRDEGDWRSPQRRARDERRAREREDLDGLAGDAAPDTPTPTPTPDPTDETRTGAVPDGSEADGPLIETDAVAPAPARGNRGPSDLPLVDPSRGTRLQKVLASSGIASRRACEQLVADGEVRINGRAVTRLPIFVDPNRDRIEVAGKRLVQPDRHVYVMLFKPRGVLSTNDEHADRRRAVDLVHHPSGVRLFPVGRLDVESSGLLLLTSDGELANRLTHPRYGVHKQYEVTVDGRVDPNQIERLQRGVFLSDRRSSHGQRPGRRTSQSRLSIIHSDRDRTHLLMELSEGRNRQIRRMMLYVGHKVRKLRRVGMGPLRLRGLQVGEWRDLSAGELSALKRAAWAEDRRAHKEAADIAAGRTPQTDEDRRRQSRRDRDQARRPGTKSGRRGGPGSRSKFASGAGSRGSTSRGPESRDSGSRDSRSRGSASRDAGPRGSGSRDSGSRGSGSRRSGSGGSGPRRSG